MEKIQQLFTRHDLPKDAIVISRNEAITHKMHLIQNWEPKRNVWSLIWGRDILTAAVIISNGYINHRFRRAIKFRSYGFLSMGGIILTPALMLSLMYKESEGDIMLMEFSCSACLQSTSILLQTVQGLLIPLLLAPMLNFTIANHSGLYNFPFITDVRGTFKILRLAYQPMIPSITMIFILHALLAGFITYSQIKSMFYVEEMLYLIQQEEKSKDMH